MVDKPGKKRNPIVDELAAQLRQEIREGILRPNERILEDELAKRFGTSRTPVREALRILESEGSVTIFPRRGVYVSEIDQDDIMAMFEVRPVLEGLAAKLACRNMTKKECNYLSQIADRMADAVDNDNFRLYFELNNEFHQIVYMATRNKYLLKILQTLYEQSQRYKFFPLVLSRQLKQSVKKHFVLLEAFREKNEKKAERIRYKQMLKNRSEIVFLSKL